MSVSEPEFSAMPAEAVVKQSTSSNSWSVGEPNVVPEKEAETKPVPELLAHAVGKAPPDSRFWCIWGGVFLGQCLTLQLYNWFPQLRHAISPIDDLGVLALAGLWGTLLAMFALLAFLAVWAPFRGTLRLLSTVGLGAVTITIFSYALGGPVPNWQIALILYVVLACQVGLALLVARLTGLRLDRGSPGHQTELAASQFSLQYLMAWSLFFALLFAAARAMIGNRQLAELVPDLNKLIEGLTVFAVLFGANFLLATPVVLSLLGVGRWRWWFFVGSLLAMIPIGWLEYWILNQIPASVISFLALFSLHSVQMAWISLTFAGMRWFGYRLTARRGVAVADGLPA